LAIFHLPSALNQLLPLDIHSIYLFTQHILVAKPIIFGSFLIIKTSSRLLLAPWCVFCFVNLLYCKIYAILKPDHFKNLGETEDKVES